MVKNRGLCPHRKNHQLGWWMFILFDMCHRMLYNKNDFRCLRGGAPFAMRRILEPALLRGLAGKLTPVQLDEFRALLDRQNTDLYIDQDAADDFFISLDNDFHRLLYHDSGYDRIWEAMHNVTSHMDRVRYLDSALCRGNIASVQKEHVQIFVYLRDGLPPQVDAEALFEHHLGMYRENFAQILERFPDFFLKK